MGNSSVRSFWGILLLGQGGRLIFGFGIGCMDFSFYFGNISGKITFFSQKKKRNVKNQKFGVHRSFS